MGSESWRALRRWGTRWGQAGTARRGEGCAAAAGAQLPEPGTRAPATRLLTSGASRQQPRAG